MLVKKHVRLNNEVYKEIEQMAKSRKVKPPMLIRELIDIGLRVKKHMENKKSEAKEEPALNNRLLETGGVSAIEALLLLRTIANNTNLEWAKEAHTEAIKRVNELQEE